MPQHALDQGAIRESIKQARERRDRAYAEFEAATHELEWLEDGLRLLGADSSDRDGDTLLRDLLREGTAIRQPTLRQAMILVMRANPEGNWTVADIVRALEMNGWAPRRGEATKRVSDMAGVMVTEGHLHRTGRGVYKLSRLLAGAIARALPPITDYRVAATYGLPVPDHPGDSGGLCDD